MRILIVNFVLQESQMLSQKMQFPGGQVSHFFNYLCTYSESGIKLQHLVDYSVSWCIVKESLIILISKVVSQEKWQTFYCKYQTEHFYASAPMTALAGGIVF